MSTPSTFVYLGDQIQDGHELRFLARLRADLSRAGIAATICANFIADARNAARQVDFLVLTAHRLVHIELKTVRQDSPVQGRANGHWRQLLPGGQTRSWKNAYRQAHQTTYAISDDVRRMVSQGTLPDVGEFFRSIDTVVCLFPDVPADSQIERFSHVAACGYESLFDRLTTPGPRPSGWTAEHGEAFARGLGLYAEPVDVRADSRRADDLNALASYRSRFIEANELDLHELVPVRATDNRGRQRPVPLEDVLDAIRGAESLIFTGPSGSGKSHTVRHAALRAARDLAMPVWLTCGDYEGDTFAVAMAKAVARFTPERWTDLFEQATRLGIVPMIVLDGLNECSPNQRRILLEGASAYRASRGSAVIMTAHEPAQLAGATTLYAQTPSSEERAELLDSYGAPSLPNVDAFRTPLELAMAATCANELDNDAGPEDVFDVYIRRHTGSERERDQLRALAFAMQRGVQLSLPVAQARTTLRTYSDRLPTADEFELLLGSRLLVVGPQRLAFTHESFGRFLATEHIVLNSASGHELAQFLSEPALADLSDLAMNVEKDSGRRLETLTALADAELIAKAARGHNGPETETQVRAAMAETLRCAAAITVGARFVYTDDLERPASIFPGHWILPRPTSNADLAFLTACGLCLADGILVPEVVELLDATDAHSAAAMRDLRERGVRTPITAVVAATYTPGITHHGPRHPGRGDLPATTILRACESDRIRFGKESSHEPHGTRVRFGAPGPARWGRIRAALLVRNLDSLEDLNLTTQLVEEAWNLGGYHLRLKALETAPGAAWRMARTSREALERVLDGFDVSGNLVYSTLLIEALAACGSIEPITTAEEIREDIDHVLRNRHLPESGMIARSILGRMFEAETIHGPYAEVVTGLEPRELVALCGLSICNDTDAEVTSTRNWAIEKIADHIHLAETDIRRAIEEIAAEPPLPTMMAGDGVKAHFEALRAWSQIAETLPDPAATSTDPPAQTWRLIDELVFPLIRGEHPAEHAPRIWDELSGPCRPSAVDALLQLRRLQRWRGTTAAIYPQLTRQYPEQLRSLYEWALENWPKVTSSVEHHFHTTRDALVSELSQIGNTRTGAMLRKHINDPDLASVIIQAIRAIETRQA